MKLQKAFVKSVSAFLSIVTASALLFECVPMRNTVFAEIDFADNASLQKMIETYSGPTLEDIKAIQAFCLTKDYEGEGRIVDINKDNIIDVFDLALAKREYIDFFSDNIVPTHIILHVGDTELSYGTATELDITFCLPTECHITTVSFYLDGSLYVKKGISDFSEPLTMSLNDVSYDFYSTKLLINDFGSADISFSKELYATMEEYTSNSITLYRSVPISDDVPKRACDVLDDLSSITTSLYQTNTLSNDTIVIEAEPKDIINRIASYLEESEDIATVEQMGNYIRFTTIDGFNSFYALSTT